jgi:hypothetical protein
VVEELDHVARYALSLGLVIRPRTVLVEGVSDVSLFEIAARLEQRQSGLDMFENGLAIVAAGEGDRGGTYGVIRELIVFRALARTLLLPNGRPKYRFIGVFDNDRAGRQAVKSLRDVDSSVLEFKDVFRLRPVMPRPTNLDPKSLHAAFEESNEAHKGLDWELEDALAPDFLGAFLAEHSGAVARSGAIGGRIHRDLTRDGKARLHHYVKVHAMHRDVQGVVDILRAIRLYLGLK